MKLENYLDYLGEFLKKYLNQSGLDGYVLGVSGGVDSAVVAGLLSKYLPNNHLCLVLPINQNIDDALLVCNDFKLNHKVVDLTSIYNESLNTFDNDNNLANINLKVRLRMVTLYHYAQNNKMLVIGTDNLCEYFTGYFTKFGDGAYDINPLVHLTKDEVYQAAKILGVNDKIINKKPSADLIEGVNDEDELKVSYDSLNKFLKHQKVNDEDKERIKYLNKISKHKRELPVFPKPFK